MAQIEQEIIPSLHVADEDLEAVREELQGLLRKDHHSLEAESHIMTTKLAHLKDRSQALLDMRLDKEITKDEFSEKRATFDIEQAKVTKKLEQSDALLRQGEDDLGRALALANQLPKLWAQADEDGRRKVLEAVFEAFVVEGKRVVDVEVRAPYGWLVDHVAVASTAI